MLIRYTDTSTGKVEETRQPYVLNPDKAGERVDAFCGHQSKIYKRVEAIENGWKALGHESTGWKLMRETERDGDDAFSMVSSDGHTVRIEIDCENIPACLSFFHRQEINESVKDFIDCVDRAQCHVKDERGNVYVLPLYKDTGCDADVIKEYYDILDPNDRGLAVWNKVEELLRFAKRDNEAEKYVYIQNAGDGKVAYGFSPCIREKHPPRKMWTTNVEWSADTIRALDGKWLAVGREWLNEKEGPCSEHQLDYYAWSLWQADQRAEKRANNWEKCEQAFKSAGTEENEEVYRGFLELVIGDNFEGNYNGYLVANGKDPIDMNFDPLGYEHIKPASDYNDYDIEEKVEYADPDDSVYEALAEMSPAFEDAMREAELDLSVLRAESEMDRELSDDARFDCDFDTNDIR